ncbi:MAG: ABC-2 family transporter protein [Selenomonadales bacterium]|nr:ABC-2 family transporter protein [Selenomonadales bacterium]
MFSHAIKKYTLLASTSLASKLAYPLDALVRSIFFAMVLFIFTKLWSTLLGADRAILGFSRAQMVWYLMATESIMLSNARIERRIEDEVKSGAVAYTLVRPLHFVWYQCAIFCGETLGHFLLNAIVGAAVAFALVGLPPASLASIPAVLLVAAMAFLMQFFIKVTIAMLAFWVEDTQPFFWVYSKILFTLGGLFVPIDVYPEWLKRIAEILPFNYVLYQPARLFVSFDKEAFLRAAGMQVLWVVALVVLAFFTFRRGVKKVSVNGG